MKGIWEHLERYGVNDGKNCRKAGFTFEYSATFNQVASKKDPELLNAYGKCMLFDYSYRQFHEDGYGKDYAISNLPSGMEDLNSNMYLLGCLLTFYQQYRIWNEKGAQWSAFNVTETIVGISWQNRNRWPQ